MATYSYEVRHSNTGSALMVDAARPWLVVLLKDGSVRSISSRYADRSNAAARARLLNKREAA